MGDSPVSIGNDARRVRRGAVVTVAWPARLADPPARLPTARHPRGAVLSADGQNEHARVRGRVVWFPTTRIIASRCRGTKSIVARLAFGRDSDLEAFSHNPPPQMVASHHWLISQAPKPKFPNVWTCGSSRTELSLLSNNYIVFPGNLGHGIGRYQHPHPPDNYSQDNSAPPPGRPRKPRKFDNAWVGLNEKNELPKKEGKRKRTEGYRTKNLVFQGIPLMTTWTSYPRAQQ